VSLNVDWEPFYLNRNTPPEGEDLLEHLKAKYGPAAVARFDAPDNPLDRAASQIGITFNKQRRIIRTGDSHRLVEWCKARAPQKLDPLMEELFKAYFTDAKDLSQRAELVASSERKMDSAAHASARMGLRTHRPARELVYDSAQEALKSEFDGMLLATSDLKEAADRCSAEAASIMATKKELQTFLGEKKQCLALENKCAMVTIM